VDGIFDLILYQPVDLEPLARSGAPPRLLELIQELTDKDPSRRPQDFVAVVHRIDLIAV
jgi:hypothetical protein